MSENIKKRIAILSNYPFDGKSFTGGVETATEGLLEGLREYQNEFEFYVVSLSNKIVKDKVIERNGFRFVFIAIPQRIFLKPHLPYNIIKVWRKIRDISPDLVHCQDNMALAIASIFSGFPRIFTVHGIKRMEAKLWKGKEYWSHQMDRVLERFVYQFFNKIISISPYVSKLMTNNKTIFEIPNPLSNKFINIEWMPKYTNKPYILYIGPLVHIKQPLVLVYAFIEIIKEFPDLQLILCGNREDPEYASKIEKVIQRNNVSGISFLDNLTREEIRNYLAKASVLVLPSLQENSPMVIAEAMCLGVPVIASNVGGIPFMIENKKTGLLFRPGNIAELVNCMKLILRDKVLYNAIRHEAREKARRLYKPENIAGKTIKVYQEALRN